MASLFPQSPHTMFTQQVEVINHNRLFIDNLIQEGADLHEILNKLHAAGDMDTLEIRINSGGGFVRYGQQLINVIKDKFYERCVTILDAEAASMAAVLFMAGDQRIVYPHSVLMVHDVSMFSDGKANETRRQMDTYLPVFMAYFKDIFGDTMTTKEIKAMFDGKDYWFDAKDMCKRGMANFVIVNGQNVSAEEYLGMLTEEEEELLSIKPKKKKKEKKVAKNSRNR